MWMTIDLEALAQRVEALAGPDYLVDREVMLAVGLTPPSSWSMQYDGETVPSYTGSLDAPMGLVPDGDDICLVVSVGPWVGCNVKIWRACGPGETAWEVDGTADTPSLALAAAALRARAWALGGLSSQV
jgi:hypothetical protein